MLKEFDLWGFMVTKVAEPINPVYLANTRRKKPKQSESSFIM
jgi:hypothetical protein